MLPLWVLFLGLVPISYVASIDGVFPPPRPAAPGTPWPARTTRVSSRSTARCTGRAPLFGLVGGALDLNHWIVDVSPFTHLPHLPGGTVHATPLGWLLAVAAALTAVGLTALRRRDVPVS